MKKRFLLTLFFLLIFSSAVLAYKAVVKTDNKDIASKIFFSLGKDSFDRGNYENAIKYFKKSIELSQNFKEAYYNLGIAYYYNGNVNDAIYYLQKAIELNENYAKAHYSLGLVYYNSKNFDSAIKHFSKTIEIEPNNPSAHFDLAVAYVDRFRAKESIKKIEEQDLADLKKAEENYLEAEKIEHGFPNALSNARIVKSVLDDYKI